VEENVNERRLGLTSNERLLAAQAANHFLTYVEGKQNYTPVKGWKDNEERQKQLILAYAAEIGVAKKLKKQWNGMSTGKRQADIGNNIEVRWTSTEYAIVYENDRDNDLLFLVKGATIDDLYIAGFIPIKMAKVEAYKREREGLPVTYWVPIDKLYTYLPGNGAVTAFIDRFTRWV
jgi:hypothetical protein